jgi:hypothetical protein
MDGLDCFGTPLSYHKTLSGDLGLIHSVSRFQVSGFHDLQKRGVLPFGFSGVEMLKPFHA